MLTINLLNNFPIHSINFLKEDVEQERRHQTHMLGNDHRDYCFTIRDKGYRRGLENSRRKYIEEQMIGKELAKRIQTDFYEQEIGKKRQFRSRAEARESKMTWIDALETNRRNSEQQMFRKELIKRIQTYIYEQDVERKRQFCIRAGAREREMKWIKELEEIEKAALIEQRKAKRKIFLRKQFEEANRKKRERRQPSSVSCSRQRSQFQLMRGHDDCLHFVKPRVASQDAPLRHSGRYEKTDTKMKVPFDRDTLPETKPDTFIVDKQSHHPIDVFSKSTAPSNNLRKPVVEDASDSECEDEFRDYFHNRRPKAGEWIEPVDGIDIKF